MGEINFSDLARTDHQNLLVDIMYASDHATRLSCVNRALDYAITRMVEGRQYMKELSEDELTIQLVNALNFMGIEASHDTAVGGHCDVVVRMKGGFLWLGEAKIHNDYEYLFGGFQQLNTRYSTGLSGQDVGGIIIYNFGQRIDKVMAAWGALLLERVSDVVITQCAINKLAFESVHLHDGTGLPLRIRHVPVPLYFKPQDNVTRPAGRKKRKSTVL